MEWWHFIRKKVFERPQDKKNTRHNVEVNEGRIH